MPNWTKLAAGWALAATIALAFSWGAVAQVRNRVIEPTVEIPTAAASASTPAPPGQTTTSAPSVIRLEPEVIDSANSTIPLPVTSITTTAQPPGTTSTTTPQAPPTATITTAAPQTQTSSYTLVGGVVTISYSPGVITFVSAIPQPGFSTDRTATGPDEVRIRFESESHTSDFHAEWKEGELKITKNETGQG